MTKTRIAGTAAASVVGQNLLKLENALNGGFVGAPANTFTLWGCRAVGCRDT